MESTSEATVVIPAYNEREGLPQVLERLMRVRRPGWEVIVVDDGSTDGTPQVAERFPVRLIRLPHNQGKGTALRTAFAQARGEVVVWLDADGTYPVEAIPDLVARVRNGEDVVYASRLRGREHIPWFNRIGNALFRFLAHLSGFKPRDPCTGLCAVRREVLDRMDLRSRGFGIEMEVAVKAGRLGLRTGEHPIAYGKRIGRPKLRALRDGLDILLTGLWALLLWNPRPRAPR